MANKGSGKYLVIERDSIGNMPYHTAETGCQVNDYGAFKRKHL